MRYGRHQQAKNRFTFAFFEELRHRAPGSCSNITLNVQRLSLTGHYRNSGYEPDIGNSMNESHCPTSIPDLRNGVRPE
jgi:hypothetical protein